MSGRHRHCTTGFCPSFGFAAAALSHYLPLSQHCACFFPRPGSGWPQGAPGGPRGAPGGCVWHCSPCHPQPALSWSSLYSLATLPLLHAGSLHKIYGSCSKFFSFFITSRSSLFLSNLGKPRPCSLKKKKTLKKKRLSLPFCLFTDASHLHDSEKMKAKRSWDIDCKNGLKSFI